MTNKNIILVSILALVMIISAFAYKSYSVNLQKEKELFIIEAQQQKEQAILQEKNDAQEKEKLEKSAALKSCIVQAKNLERTQWQNIFNSFGSGAIGNTNALDLVTNAIAFCNKLPTTKEQNACISILSEHSSNIIRDFNEAETKCYNRFPTY